MMKNDVWLQMRDALSGSAGVNERRDFSQPQHEVDENIYH